MRVEIPPQKTSVIETNNPEKNRYKGIVGGKGISMIVTYNQFEKTLYVQKIYLQIL